MRFGSRRVFIVGVLFLLIGLSLSPSTLAASKTYYSGWAYPGDTITVNNALYAVSEGSDPYQLLLKKGADEYLLKYRDCATSRDGLERYCFNASDYADCEYGRYSCPKRCATTDATCVEPEGAWCCPYDVTHLKFASGKAHWGAYLQFYDVVPVMKLSRVVSAKTLKLGEEARVMVTFENTGDDAITGGVYRETIPRGFTVRSPDFTVVETADGTNLTLKVSLGPSGQKVVQYTLTPKEYETAVVQGRFSYVYKGEARNVTPTTYSVSVPSPFLVTHSLAKTTLEPGEETAYAYTIKNADSTSELVANVTFTGFDGVIVKRDGIGNESGALVLRARLKPGESKTGSFTISPKRTGVFSFIGNSSILVGGARFDYAVTDVAAVKTLPLSAKFQLSASSVKAGAPYVLRVLLTAPKTRLSFKELAVNVSSNYNGFSRRSLARPTVPLDTTFVLAEYNLTAPSVDEKTTISFSLNGRYASPYGEPFTFAAAASLPVEPVTHGYKVTQTVSPTTVHAGKNVSVTVKVKNKYAEYHDVTVEDALPSGIVLAAGVREQSLGLQKLEEKKAYEYTITIPEDYVGDVYVVKTLVTDGQSGNVTSASTDVTVIPKPVVVENVTVAANASSTSTSTSEGSRGETASVEKKGFFSELFGAIGGFFKGLFS